MASKSIDALNWLRVIIDVWGSRNSKKLVISQ